MMRWRQVVERRRWRSVERVFRDSETEDTRSLSIRLTARGIWLPAPFPVLAVLLRATRARGLFESRELGRRGVLDAGAGDGRLLAALAYFEPELDIVGIESDERLFQRAAGNLETLKRKGLIGRPERIRLARGDYLQIGTYEAIGIRIEDLAFVVNYPDGNQEELERFLLERTAPGVKLCLLTHDRDLRLSRLALSSIERIEVADPTCDWHWSIYST